MVGLSTAAWAADARLPLVALDDLSGSLAGRVAYLGSTRLASMHRDSAAGDLVLLRRQGETQPEVLAAAPGQGVAAAARLRRRADVVYAEPDRVVPRQFVPNDPLLGSQWHHAVIRSSAAWDLGPRGGPVLIGIVDLPFQMGHPDLAANSAPGWDVVNETPIYDAPGDAHATFCAGMAAAVLDNGLGVAGAGNCRILPIRVNGYLSELCQAVLWAASHGVRAVSISYLAAGSEALNDAGRVLRESNGGLLFVSAGNGEGRVEDPDQPFIEAVSMTDSADQSASLQGPHVDLAAPGLQVFSTTAGSGFTSGSGTSYATPLVAGIAAVLLSRHPALDGAAVARVLHDSAVDLGPPGRDEAYGWGRVDFEAAAWLAMAAAGAAPSLRLRAVSAATSLAVTADFHRGLRSRLLVAVPPDSGAWVEAAATGIATGATDITWETPVPSTTAWYRVEGLWP